MTNRCKDYQFAVLANGKERLFELYADACEFLDKSSPETAIAGFKCKPYRDGLILVEHS